MRCWLYLFFTTLLGFLECCSDAQAVDRILRERLEAFAAGVETRKLESGAAIGLYAQEVDSDKELFEHNGSTKLVPASVLKVVTTLASLRVLGAEYRFPTEVFVDSLPGENDVSMDRSSGVGGGDPKGWHAGNLYLRGYGDPGMIDERLWELARVVHRRGVRDIQHLVVDDTLFINPPPASGPDPYSAALGAASLNHNSYALHIAPSSSTLPAFVELTQGAPYLLVNRLKSLQSAESSIIINQSHASAGYNPQLGQRKMGNFRVLGGDEITITVQGYIGVKSPSETQYRSVPSPASYFGSVLRHHLANNGVVVRGSVLFGETPSAAKLLFAYQSEPLTQILQDLNHYSSNFIAGQLIYALGQDGKGYFRYELGLQRLRSTVAELGFSQDSFAIFDGSGLDRRNLITAEQLVKVLLEAYRDFSVLPDFFSSFSRFGHTGTLKQRRLLNQDVVRTVLKRELPEVKRRSESVWGKTGTIDGVSSLTGLLELANGHRAAFAIVINGMDKSRAAQIEDEFVQLLIGIGAKQ